MNDENNENQAAPKAPASLPFLLLIALSAHAMFEGMALGLMNSLAPFINLWISILIDKSAEAISISIAMQKAEFPFKKMLIFLLMFSVVTPIGISIGILLRNASPLVNIIFTALAGGTFVYVSCSKLIVEEFTLPGDRWIKLTAFCLGAIFIGSLLFIL